MYFLCRAFSLKNLPSVWPWQTNRRIIRHYSFYPVSVDTNARYSLVASAFFNVYRNENESGKKCMAEWRCCRCLFIIIVLYDIRSCSSEQKDKRVYVANAFTIAALFLLLWEIVAKVAIRNRWKTFHAAAFKGTLAALISFSCLCFQRKYINDGTNPVEI